MSNPAGSANSSWKGDAAKPDALHQWIAKHFPRTGRCEYCGVTDRKTEYASASHERYTRNRADWFEFCRSCHRRFDGHGAKITAIQTGKTMAERKAAAKVNLKYNGRGHPRGADNPLWKGDAVTDGTIHVQVNLHYPRTGTCEHCGSTDRRTEYATKDHSKPYSREREGWLELCRRCHAAYDGFAEKARATHTGRKHSAETRAKMAAASKGRKHSAETRKKIAEARERQVVAHSAETRAKMAAAARGRRHSAETRAKIAAARKGQVISAKSPETKARIAAGVKAAHRRCKEGEKGGDA